MNKDNQDVEINIPVFEILLGIGIIVTIIGIIAPMQKVDVLGITLWFDPNLSMILLPIGIGLICGYITKKILPNQKGAYWIGFFLGFIGLIIAICIKPSKNTNKNNSSNNKYEDLQKLEELKQNGTITEAKFEIQKSKILKGE